MQSIATITNQIETKILSGNAPVFEDTRRKLQRVTLDTLDTSHHAVKGAVDMARAWAQRKRDGVQDASVVLAGGVGTGKTHIARAILWSMCYCLEDGSHTVPVGRFFHATDLIMSLEPTKNAYNMTEIPRASSIIGGAPIVIIDDVGSEMKIPFVAKDSMMDEVQARYFRIIDYCYTAQISLVITSNLGLEQLASHLGRRSWDRLGVMAPAGFMWEMGNAPSWRKKESGR